MRCSAKPTSPEALLPWRERFRQEMNCQIVHDSLHGRRGWTESYLLRLDETATGYGSLAIAGPWKNTRTIFEYYVAPERRAHAFNLFEALLAASGVTHFEVQTNNTLLAVMSHCWSRSLTSEKIVFADQFETHLPANGTNLRRVVPEDIAALSQRQLDPEAEYLLEFDGGVVASGGVLYHYNRPYGDIYMAVAEAYRRRGFGSYLVQELKRVCRAGGSVPCARCSPTNIASRQTCQKAGLVPYAHILVGPLTETAPRTC